MERSVGGFGGLIINHFGSFRDAMLNLLTV